VVGQTPADYLSDWRIALAQSRLREGRSIKALADELGYANPSALSRAFTARTGASPRDWLKARSDATEAAAATATAAAQA
jgi:AraC-like DNA-binding protein